ncbi:MAG: AbrB/MazE/SpoVT family DNA-binding domain-containing protein [Dehalococcoidia bacterium]
MTIIEDMTKLGSNGRLVIPAKYRKLLGIKPGDEVVLTVADGELRILPLREAVKRAQETLRKYIPEGRSLSEELVQERRAEGTRE